MQSIHVVVAHTDRTAAEQLADNLSTYFRRVCIAEGAEDLRGAIARNRAQLAVIDMELITTDDLHELCQEFEATAIVCVHRCPDEEKWIRAINAGAQECCHISDIHSILNALRAQSPKKFAAAAAA